MEYYSVIKKMKYDIFSKIDRPRDYHTKSEVSERQIAYAVTHM